MPGVQSVDPALVDLVRRLEMVCLVEAVQPGFIKHLIVELSSVLQEPPVERFVYVAQGACITLGRMTAANRGNLVGVGEVIDGFWSNNLAGLSALSRHVRHPNADVVVRQVQQFGQLLSTEAQSAESVRVDKRAQETLAASRPPFQLVQGVTYTFAAALGTLARAHGWNPEELREIVQKAHEGVLAGEAARNEDQAR